MERMEKQTAVSWLVNEHLGDEKRLHYGLLFHIGTKQ
jgi:hypothetical protein